MPRRPRPTPRPGPPADRGAAVLPVVRGIVLWIVPVTLVWILVTPLYNRVLARTVQGLLRASERPPVTRLHVRGTHDVLVTRSDYGGGQGYLYTIRATDVQFNVLLVAVLFLAVPGVPWRRRLAALGWALLLSVAFHLLLLFCFVKFVYATQLGDWSLRHYGPVARNAWGLAKHLLDLPVKFALPFVLWAGFYLRRYLPAAAAERA